jgi:predicted nucleic acid-binding protein
MALYFLDTSALVKRYIEETGSAWTRRLCVTQSIVVSAIALAEISSTFARRNRESTLSIDDRNALLHTFHTHVVQYTLVEVNRPVLSAAGALLLSAPASIPMRSLDAIQLASAQSFAATSTTSGFGPLTFVSSDTRLLAAAEWAGIATDNPESHP